MRKLARQDQARIRAAEREEDRLFGKRQGKWSKPKLDHDYSIFIDHVRDFTRGPRPTIEPRPAPEGFFGATRYGRFDTISLPTY